jgi:hypothetical protein
MIFLTGDVHDMGPGMKDQMRLSHGLTEVKLCQTYLEYANAHNIRPTLFFTGRAVETEANVVRTLAHRYRFEVGGHTYSISGHRVARGLSRRFLGLANGPYWLQQRDMSRTLCCLRDCLRETVTAWRNHAYRTDRNTYRIAASLGIRQISNTVTGLEGRARVIDGILEVPINTLPDHESLGHGEHERVCRSSEEWVDRVLQQIEYHQGRGMPSVILAHPLCMFIEDNFAAFKRLCAAIGTMKTATLRECSPPCYKETSSRELRSQEACS